MKKLNFGCGEDVKEGYDNIDIQKGPKIIKSFDFDKFPYPLKDDLYDYVYCRNVLEHLEEPNKILNELWRICKNKAVIEIIVPYYNNKSAFGDFNHKHYFSEQCFLDYANEYNVTDKRKRYHIETLELVPTIVGKFIPKIIRDKLSLFLGGIISYIYIKLEVNK